MHLCSVHHDGDGLFLPPSLRVKEPSRPATTGVCPWPGCTVPQAHVKKWTRRSCFHWSPRHCQLVADWLMYVTQYVCHGMYHRLQITRLCCEPSTLYTFKCTNQIARHARTSYDTVDHIQSYDIRLPRLMYTMQQVVRVCSRSPVASRRFCTGTSRAPAPRRRRGRPWLRLTGGLVALGAAGAGYKYWRADFMQRRKVRVGAEGVVRFFRYFQQKIMIIISITFIQTFHFHLRSLWVGLTISLDYWWTLRGLEEVAIFYDLHAHTGSDQNLRDRRKGRPLLYCSSYSTVAWLHRCITCVHQMLAW